MIVTNKTWSYAFEGIASKERIRKADELYCPVLRDGRPRWPAMICGEDIHIYRKKVSFSGASCGLTLIFLDWYSLESCPRLSESDLRKRICRRGTKTQSGADSLRRCCSQPQYAARWPGSNQEKSSLWRARVRLGFPSRDHRTSIQQKLVHWRDWWLGASFLYSGWHQQYRN